MLLLASIGVLAFLIFGQQISKRLETEVYKQTYQFLLLVVVGGAVSLVYKEFSDEQVRYEERRILLRKMHSELLDVFNSAKLVRRTLRARIGYSHDREAMMHRVVKDSDYREQMAILMVSQLKFEVYSKQATDRVLFFTQGERLRKSYRTIEHYLRQIIEEYEINLITFAEAPLGKPLSELPKLAEFIGPFQKDLEFDVNFKLPFRDVLSELSRADPT
jgi:hypothetical protein